MDHPDLMSPLNNGDSFFRDAFAAEKDYGNAVSKAIQLHCKGRYVPEDIARFCRECAVNLNRDLARGRGEELPTLGYLKDYHI